MEDNIKKFERKLLNKEIKINFNLHKGTTINSLNIYLNNKQIIIHTIMILKK